MNKREFNKKLKENIGIIDNKMKEAEINNYNDYISKYGVESGYGEYDPGYLSMLDNNEKKELAARIYTALQEKRQKDLELHSLLGGFGRSAEARFAESQKREEESLRAKIEAEHNARNERWNERVRADLAASDREEARKEREHQMYLQGKQAYENSISKYTPSQRTKDLLASNPRLSGDFIAVGKEGDKHIIPVSYLRNNRK